MIIVTGGAGFIGSALVWELNTRGEKDILIVDELRSGDKWKNLCQLSYTDFMHKDAFIEEVRWNGLPEGTTAVIHMGACSSTTEQDADYLMENNVHYSRDLATACVNEGIRFIYASSAATYGAGERGYVDDVDDLERLVPLNKYGYSKQRFDLWLKQMGWLDKVVGFKFFNVYGPNEYHKETMRSMVLKAFEQIQAEGKVKLFENHREGHKNGDETRDFVYVKDVCQCVLHVLGDPSVNGLFNIGTGKPRTFLDLVNAVFAAMKLEPNIEWIPMPEELRGQYQYFTKADTANLNRVDIPVPMTELEDAVFDYVRNYLLKDDGYLTPPKELLRWQKAVQR